MILLILAQEISHRLASSSPHTDPFIVITAHVSRPAPRACPITHLVSPLCDATMSSFVTPDTPSFHETETGLALIILIPGLGCRRLISVSSYIHHSLHVFCIDLLNHPSHCITLPPTL